MGMPVAFTDQADFTGMSANGGLSIQAAIHKAFVNVNEEGTEAAAATVELMEIAMAMDSRPPQVPTFRADHPFLFAIRSRRSGAILFLGRVTDPTKEC